MPANHPLSFFRAVSALVLLGAAAQASFGAEERSDTDRRASRREGLPADTERRPPPLALFDTDHDGIISAAEIAAAPDVLSRLDSDKDGQLSGDELTPRPPRGGGKGGSGGGAGGGGSGGARPPREE